VKVVVDTNVTIAAFISHGACCELFAHLLRSHTLISGQFLVHELNSVLTDKFRYSRAEIEDVARLFMANSIILKEVPALPQPECRDPDDDNVLAIALAAKADCIITGDKDLLVIGRYSEIPILAPADFWRFERELQK
jgi:uncharacterized protein